MISVKDGEGAHYDAPKHHQVYAVKKITPNESQRLTVGCSYFQPDGVAEMSASDTEKAYYVVKGSITVSGKNNESHVLNPGDLIYIAAGEEREMRVNDGRPAEVLVILVNP